MLTSSVSVNWKWDLMLNVKGMHPLGNKGSLEFKWPSLIHTSSLTYDLSWQLNNVDVLWQKTIQFKFAILRVLWRKWILLIPFVGSQYFILHSEIISLTKKISVDKSTIWTAISVWWKSGFSQYRAPSDKGLHAILGSSNDVFTIRKVWLNPKDGLALKKRYLVHLSVKIETERDTIWRWTDSSTSVFLEPSLPGYVTLLIIYIYQ